MEESGDFDVVVVGSGFGGGPVAQRLAEAGMSVCVLERGRAWPPGSFARSPTEVARNFWDPSSGLYGLFNVWSFRHLEAIVSAGVGGGSLIYANVLLRKDPEWFKEQDGAWPITYDDLDVFYGRAETVLGANEYPFDRPPYDRTPKTIALRDAAAPLRARTGERVTWGLPKLAVSFTPPAQDPALGVPILEDPEHRNYHGHPRLTCQLIGECDLGCNVGAKNSVDYTYITHALHAGADIRPLSEVRTISASGEGYVLTYARHDPNDESPCQPRLHRIRGRRVVLAAGALWTPYLLLRNRTSLPHLSRALGTRFCGNGDFLAFARACRPDTDRGRRARSLRPSRGPVITSYLRFPDSDDVGGPDGRKRGMYVEDAGWPQFVSWIAQGVDTPKMLLRAGSFARGLVRQRQQHDVDSDFGSEISRLLGEGTVTDATIGLLGMGRDVPDGQMRLSGRSRLDIDWSEATSHAYFARMRGNMKALAAVLGGSYMESPTYTLGRRLITVHPLGGCPMGTDASTGVVDTYGEVFGHPGLYVTDGSVMPGPVGANPSLTIAAFSERCASHILEG